LPRTVARTRQPAVRKKGRDGVQADRPLITRRATVLVSDGSSARPCAAHFAPKGRSVPGPQAEPLAMGRKGKTRKGTPLSFYLRWNDFESKPVIRQGTVMKQVRGDWREFKDIPHKVRALGFKSYREYTASPLWQETKRRFLDTLKGNVFCEMCRCFGDIQVHHRTYRRLGRENMRDLAALCGACHRKIHGLSTIPKPFSGPIRIFSDETFGPPEDEKLPWEE
jgi:5-methylcytosine-specific restriction endonuclease McrA